MTAFTFMTTGDVRVRVLNCMDCGGALDRSPMVSGDDATCTACGSKWTLRPVAS